MEAPIDYHILLCLGILLAMFLSDMPKKAIVAFVVIIQICTAIMDYKLSGSESWSPFYSASIAEALGAMLIIFCARYAKNGFERKYFLLNAAFLWASAAIVPLFRYDIIIAHVDYVFYSQMVASLHLLAMLILSDGIRKFARSINDILSSDRSSISNLRG